MDHLKAANIIGNFVLRARRVLAHSLAADREKVLEQAGGPAEFIRAKDSDGHAVFDEDGTPGYIEWRKVPPEELLESALVRIRPLVLESDDVFHVKVLNAIGWVLNQNPNEALSESLKHVRVNWSNYARNTKVVAYQTQQRNPEGQYGEARSNHELAMAYLYGDSVHMDVDKLEQTKDLGVVARYIAVTPYVFGVIFCVYETMDIIHSLVDQQHISLPPDIFEVPVVVTDTEIRSQRFVRSLPPS